MRKEHAGKGPLERFAGFAERLNYFLGAVAVAGAVVFESVALGVLGALQFAEGRVWKWLKERRAKKIGNLALSGSKA
jgi:hypothetical protein